MDKDKFYFLVDTLTNTVLTCFFDSLRKSSQINQNDLVNASFVVDAGMSVFISALMTLLETAKNNIGSDTELNKRIQEMKSSIFGLFPRKDFNISMVSSNKFN